MHVSPMHYFPLTPLFLAVFGTILILVVALVEIGVLSYAYEKMGVSRRYIFGILVLTLLGSSVNIPIAEFPAKNIPVQEVVLILRRAIRGAGGRTRRQDHSGDQPGRGTGSLGISIYLLVARRLYWEGLLGVAVVAGVTHLFARPVVGVGIALSPLVSPVVAAIAAILISRRNAAPLAYIAGSVGTLLGADVLNLYRIQQLGAPRRIDWRGRRGRRRIPGGHRRGPVGVRAALAK